MEIVNVEIYINVRTRSSHTQVSSSPGNLRSCRNAAAVWWVVGERVSDAKMLIAFVCYYWPLLRSVRCMFQCEAAAARKWCDNKQSKAMQIGGSLHFQTKYLEILRRKILHLNVSHLPRKAPSARRLKPSLF